MGYLQLSVVQDAHLPVLQSYLASATGFSGLLGFLRPCIAVKGVILKSCKKAGLENLMYIPRLRECIGFDRVANPFRVWGLGFRV